MITLKSAREIEAMDKAGDFLASIHIGLRDIIKPGVDMWEVEEYVRRRCKEENFLPLQIGVDGAIMDYPYATCCSLNDEVAHAFPRHYILKEGDLLKVDMVLGGPIAKSDLNVSKLNFNNVEQMKKYTQNFTGGLADSCWAYAVGKPSEEVKNLMDVTKEAMYKGIEQAVVGTIEPMINTGDWEIDTDMKTGWAHKTIDGGLSCQYEHQFVITKDGPVILTSQGEEGTY